MKDDKRQIIEKITIAGGTHGNEYIGPYFIAKVEQLGTYRDNAIKSGNTPCQSGSLCPGKTLY